MSERKYYEAYDDRYRQVHTENLQWFAEEPSEIVSQIIERYGIGKSASILEIGCGEGRDARPLLKENFCLWATDISPEAVSYCQKRDPEHADHYRVLDCIGGHMDERFDFIYAVAVLHMNAQHKRQYHCRQHSQQRDLDQQLRKGAGRLFADGRLRRIRRLGKNLAGSVRLTHDGRIHLPNGESASARLPASALPAQCRRNR